MKKSFVLTIGFCFAIIAIIFSSCKHGCGGASEASQYNSNNSHYSGLNCFNCHSGTGEGTSCFAVAGTVFDKNKSGTKSNPTVRLYSKPDGAGVLIKTIEGDELGNFYDGNADGLGVRFYPVVISPNGSIQKMLEPITTGACNSCHGITTDRIWVD